VTSRRALTIAAFTALAAVGAMFILISVEALRFWYPLDVGEGILLDQAMRLARGQNIYTSLTSPPYVVSSYPPIFVLVQVPFAWMFGPTLVYGRLISQGSAAAAGVFLGSTVFRLTGDRVAGWASCLLVLALPVLIFWAQANRIDVLAVALGWAGLFLIVRKESPSIAGAAALIVAAAYTRQTAWLAPFAAAVAHLASTGRWRAAMRFAVYVAAFSVGALLILQAATQGNFLANILSMGGDPWDTSKLLPGFLYAGSEIRVLLPVAGLALVAGLLSGRPGAAMAAAYLVVATLIGALYVKVGAYVNYLIEFSVAIVFLTGLVLGWMRERPAARTLTMAAILLQALWTIRVEVRDRPVVPRVTADMAALLEMMRRTPDPIVSDNAIGLIPLSGHPLYFESYTLGMFADRGRWDAAPIMDDLRNRRIQLLALRRSPDGYLPGWWRPEMLQAIERFYLDCGHVLRYDGEGGYYVLFRPVCAPGERPGQIR
jgi:hypothetical protein